MKLHTCFAAFGAATVLSILTAGCATEATEEEPTDSSEDAVNGTPKAECKGNGTMRQGPYPTAGWTTGINASTPIDVYCKTTGTAPQQGWSTTWVGATLKGRNKFALSYVHESVVNGGCNTGTLAALLPQLPDCATLGPVPRDPSAGGNAGGGNAGGGNAGGGNAGGGNAGGGNAPGPEMAANVPPPGTQTYTLPRINSSSFDASFDMHRSSPGTITLGAVWNAYDGGGRRIGRGTCPSATYGYSSEGRYTCYGWLHTSASIEVTYWATGPIDFNRR